MIYGYARVSKMGQNLSLQIEALNKYGVDKIYQEKVSGNALKRPVLNKLLSNLKKGDSVVIWKLDRLGRRTIELLSLQQDFEKREIALISITENLDTATSIGKMFFKLLCSFAEMERDVIAERTRAGLESARQNGHFGGRKPGLTDDAIKKAEIAAALYKQYKVEPTQTINELCKIVGVSKATFYKYLRYMNVDY